MKGGLGGWDPGLSESGAATVHSKRTGASAARRAKGASPRSPLPRRRARRAARHGRREQRSFTGGPGLRGLVAEPDGVT